MILLGLKITGLKKVAKQDAVGKNTPDLMKQQTDMTVLKAATKRRILTLIGFVFT